MRSLWIFKMEDHDDHLFHMEDNDLITILSYLDVIRIECNHRRKDENSVITKWFLVLRYFNAKV